MIFAIGSYLTGQMKFYDCVSISEKYIKIIHTICLLFYCETCNDNPVGETSIRDYYYVGYYFL